MAQELPEGTVTVLFTDVEGSTALTTSLGDEAAQAILRTHQELVRGQVEEHGGHEVDTAGDGFMVVFASARRAVACGVGIQRTLEEHNRAQPLEEQVRVRIGLNTGEVIQQEAGLFGEAVNAAARIAAKAKGGQILVSDTVRGVVGHGQDVELVDSGRFRLKGFPERWRLFEVVWQPETLARPALLERTPFVGRTTEQAELRRFLDQVAGGRGAVVMIGGEPGVGKTRIAEELAAEARQRGLLTLTGRCYEMEGAPPYIAFVEMLEAAVRLVQPQALRDALGESAPEVAKLMPELRRLFPDIPAPPELPPEQERRYLFSGVRDFLSRAGRGQPLLLVLDDLQWADDATLLLLQHIAQQLHEMPVLIVGTYRDVELDLARPLTSALEELTRQRLAHRILLKRLPEAGISAMLRALAGQEPADALVRAIYSETEGNPFFVEEVFHHLAEEGKLYDAQGRWRSDLQVSELDVPEGVRLVIGRRLERVGEQCRRVLTAAAVIGRGFSFELLEALGEVDTDALLDAIDESERAHLIAAAEDAPAQTGAHPGEARFRFAHELIRQTLLIGISEPRRQRLHLRVAEAMERLYAGVLEEHVGDLAHHLAQAGSAGDPGKTAHYLTLAGDRAIAAAAFEGALSHYKSALSLQPADDLQARADLIYKRGLALRSLGQWEEALADWRQALDAFEALGDAEALGRISSEITTQLLWGARYLEALEISHRGLRGLAERLSVDRCRLLAAGGLTRSFVGSYTAADGMLGQALAVAQALGDQRLLGEVLTYKGAHHLAYMQLREQAEASLRAAELLRRAGDLWRLADALWVAQNALRFLGRLDEVGKIGEELEPLAARLGHQGALLIAQGCREWRRLMLTADLDRYEEFAKSDLEFARSAGIQALSTSYSILGLVSFWKGSWDEALEHLQKAADLEPPGFLAGPASKGPFLQKAYAGDRDAALGMLHQNPLSLPVRYLIRQLLARRPQWLPPLQRYLARRSAGPDRGLRPNLSQTVDLPRPGQVSTVGAWTMLLLVVEGLAALGERRKAAKLYPATLAAIQSGAIVVWGFARLFQTVAGIAAAAGGHWEVAEEHYRTALRQAHELPNKMEQPEVRRWYARMLIDRDSPGDRVKARDLLTEAIAMYREIGMPKHVEMAEALLEDV